MPTIRRERRQATNLDRTGARPVFLGADGVLTVKAGGTRPKNDLERGAALCRAAELVDEFKGNLFARLSPDTRAKTFDELKATLSRVPSGGDAPRGLDANQALRLRSSAASVLLHLIEASPEPELRRPMVETYQQVARAETDPGLRENMIFQLASSAATQAGEARAVARALLTELAPIARLYQKWFASGNATVNLHWTVGRGEFWKGFTGHLKQHGFKAVGEEHQYGVTLYEKTVHKRGVGDTKFRISVREGGTNMLSPMNDPSVQIVGFDGHSDWGRTMSASVRSGPPGDGDGMLLFYNLCVGKGSLDRVCEKYPKAQVVTTFASSEFVYGDDGAIENGEGVQALLALVDGIAERAPWVPIHRRMNAAANIGRRRSWDNYITPISTLVRAKVLDRNNNGKADYLDKHFIRDIVQVAEEPSREFRPVRQTRPARVLEGTKVLAAANMVNMLCEFSSILERLNRSSKVVPAGWFEPKDGEQELVRFSRRRGRDGKLEFHMQVNGRYSHMSEEALQAIAVYQFNRYLASSGRLRLPPLEVKLNGLILFAQSLRVDEGARDDEVWRSFLSRYNLPADIRLGTVTSVLLSAKDYYYAGSPEMVERLKKQLTPQQLMQLEMVEAGEPVRQVDQEPPG